MRYALKKALVTALRLLAAFSDLFDPPSPVMGQCLFE
jgi:hypothetical protein